ncbi:MAG: tRNA (adenosine(37)-N6)-dimethylallyltransferase MiaA, partial [Spirochaetaceae bacterium]|nr:tRNA (adenosine(37)-N6)-dimethylallyltransferase MiaA [Spirochaetaceae bacterium]
ASAARISANDHYRLTRAVEILRSTGMAPSDFAPSSLPRPCHELLVLGILRPRSELNERIDARVESMFADGLADEVSGLMAKGYGADSPGMRAIGYREFFTIEGADKDEIKAAIKLHTRQYAKRQMTFFRALPGIVWIKPSLSEFTSLVGNFLLD